jgi:hypothetical protein
VTIDADLSDWTTVTPQLLSASNDVYLFPTQTPTAGDLSGSLWIACNGAYLTVAGIMTDTQIFDPGGTLSNGDAFELSIDARADGITRPRQDDHDLFLSPAGAIRDYNIPIVATVVATTEADNWRFEANIPLSEIWRLLGTGSEISAYYGLWDRDTAATPVPGSPSGPGQVMIGPTRIWELR